MRAPEFQLLKRAPRTRRPVRTQAGGNDPRFSQVMIESRQAVVESHVAIREFEIVERAPRDARLHKFFQIVAQITKTTPERKWEIDFVQQFISSHQFFKDAKRIPKYSLPKAVQLASRTMCRQSDKRRG